MHLLLVELESGLALAAVYAVLSISLTFTYSVTGVVQLAQGDVMMCGAYAGYFVGTRVANLPLVLVAGAIASAMVAAVLYQAAFRWLLNVGHLPPLVVGLAFSTAIEESLRILFFSGHPAPYPALTASLGSNGTELVVIGVTIVVGVLFAVGLRFTGVGRGLRAVADNIEMARLLGVRANRMRFLSFVVGGAIAGVAGVLVSVIYQSISFDSGAALEFVALACVLLGGLGSVPGALIGSLVIGIGQALLSTYVSSSYANALVFGVVLIVIVFRPAGILGIERTVRA
jgi:branched-chain amino acid transport system permease protein